MILFCIYSFIFGYAGLHCREWGLLSLVVCGFLIVVASLRAEHRV